MSNPTKTITTQFSNFQLMSRLMSKLTLSLDLPFMNIRIHRINLRSPILAALSTYQLTRLLAVYPTFCANFHTTPKSAHISFTATPGPLMSQSTGATSNPFPASSDHILISLLNSFTNSCQVEKLPIVIIPITVLNFLRVVFMNPMTILSSAHTLPGSH